jgi:hypothetical protein
MNNELTTMHALPPLTSVSITNLQPCTRYETFIYAILDEKYSETATEFATEPRLSVGSTVEVETNAAFDSVLVSWPAWNEVSCIEKYRVKACIACTDDCTAVESVQKSVGNPFVRKHLTGLQGGTNYTLHIQPLFKDLNIEARVIHFHTDSNDTDQVNVGDRGSDFIQCNNKAISIYITVQNCIL